MAVSVDEWMQAGARSSGGVPQAPTPLPAPFFEPDPPPVAATVAEGPDLEEPISPELILVSPPDVARRARERLSDPGVPPRRISAPVRDAPPAVAPRAPTTYMPSPDAPAVAQPSAVLTAEAVGGAPVAADPDPLPSVPLGKRGVSRATLAIGLTAVLALAISVADAVHEFRGSNSSGRPFAQTPAPAVSPVPTAVRPKKPATTSSTAAIPATPTNSAVSTSVVPITPKKPEPRFVPARVFAWPAVPGASSYVVGFYRDGKKVLERHSHARSIRLGSSFKFLAGQYRWQVFPVLGTGAKTRLGPAIVDSTFAVSAQSR